MIYHATGVEDEGHVCDVYGFLLPVLVVFGIISDNGVRGKLRLDTGMRGYQRKIVWVAMIALAARTAKNLLGINLRAYLNSLQDTLLPTIIMRCIVHSPANTTV